MKMKRIIMPSLFAVLLCSCGGNEAVQEEVVEKNVMTVKSDSCMVPYTFPAQIRGRKDISIFPQVNGTLKDVLVTEGQSVKKGQVMFQIDDTPYSTAVDHASASVDMAKANVETAQLELDATKKLFDRGVISEHQYKVHLNNLMMAAFLPQFCRISDIFCKYDNNYLRYRVIYPLNRHFPF